MSEIILSGIHIYPLKSARGISFDQTALVSRGMAYDRRWMLVDTEGRFLTQRQLPQMALIHTQLESDRLILRAQGHSDLVLPVSLAQGTTLEVQVWEDRCRALAADEPAQQWLSEVLKREVRLVYMPDETQRQVDEAYALSGDITSFADGFPLLLISEASLKDLNQRLEEDIPMRRFRPNLVVQGCEPYAEDQWRKIRIGEILFDVVKPCSRCVITTVNPETGEYSTNREPLRTLASYRRRENQVFFGQNLIHRGSGTLTVGDSVEIIEQS